MQKDDRVDGHYGRNAREQWVLVLDYIHRQGAKGATAEEVMLALDLAPGAIDPRMRELKDAGYIEPVEEKRLTTRGCPATAWRGSIGWEDREEDESPTGAYKRMARRRMRDRIIRYYRDLARYVSLETLEHELDMLVQAVHPNPESYRDHALARALYREQPGGPEPAPEPSVSAEAGAPAAPADGASAPPGA